MYSTNTNKPSISNRVLGYMPYVEFHYDLPVDVFRRTSQRASSKKTTEAIESKDYTIGAHVAGPLLILKLRR